MQTPTEAHPPARHGVAQQSVVATPRPRWRRDAGEVAPPPAPCGTGRQDGQLADRANRPDGRPVEAAPAPQVRTGAEPFSTACPSSREAPRQRIRLPRRGAPQPPRPAVRRTSSRGTERSYAAAREPRWGGTQQRCAQRPPRNQLRPPRPGAPHAAGAPRLTVQCRPLPLLTGQPEPPTVAVSVRRPTQRTPPRAAAAAGLAVHGTDP